VPLLLLRGLLTAAARELLGLVAIAAVVVACSGGDDDADGPASSTTTTFVRATAVQVPLEDGECGNVPRIDVGGPVDPASIDIVECDVEHDVEIAAVFDHPAALDARFPGTAAVDAYATDECLQRFEAYVGTPYEASSLDVAFVAPDAGGWEAGDRRVACVLYDTDFAPLTGSVRASTRTGGD
jgi:hypothetical protein